ncbi:hypothetical protein SISSUDRAFT_1006213 [Sistotremastrum suecicum HHB10207 ss-3]|uniref:Uncharacterized protein n=1 Tax=Sistotremastrum suecicum HHB10207 ss-3 TaxID=1314776 RepID=A0A166CFW2_9AGAM|nr:hypothetical protein SISSUDRAFT_1006213 [Sistotremastrum suecicum HHB10207 ss-3]
MASSSKNSSDRVAIAHNQSGVRANPKKSKAKPSDPSQRKVVYKSVLDNPQEVSWPNVPLNLQNTILARVVDLITESGISKFLQNRESRARHEKNKRRKALLEKRLSSQKGQKDASAVKPSAKRKRDEEDAIVEAAMDPLTAVADLPSSKRARISPIANGEEDQETTISVNPSTTSSPSVIEMAIVQDSKTSDSVSKGTFVPPDDIGSSGESLSPPELWNHVVFGINEVTKRLEEQSQARRHVISRGSVQTPNTHARAPLALVLVCLADINPRLLVAHVPPLVAACNSRPKDVPGLDVVHLVQLPKHSETQLADAFGVRRLSVLAFDAHTPTLSNLLAFLTSVDPPHAPWLASALPSRDANSDGPDPASSTRNLYAPTKIKQIKTTAPKDAKLAKEMRAKARAEAKSRKPAKSDKMGTKRVVIKSKTQKGA